MCQRLRDVGTLHVALREPEIIMKSTRVLINKQQKRAVEEAAEKLNFQASSRKLNLLENEHKMR